MPHDATSVVTGHTKIAQNGIEIEKNMTPYQKKRAMDLKNQVTGKMVLSQAGQQFEMAKVAFR